MHRQRSLLLVFATLLIPVVAAAQPTSSPVTDGQGDAFDIFGFGPPFHDIDTIDVTFSATHVHFLATFHTTIAPPSAFAFNSVYGALDLDTDENGSTGLAALQNGFSPPLPSVGIGVDYYVDIGSEEFHPGFVDVISSAFVITAIVPVVFTSDTIAVDVPLSALGGDDGSMRFALLAGSFFQPTDASNGVGVSVPSRSFLRSDCDGNGLLNLADAVFALDYMTLGGDEPPCLDGCDVNDNGMLNIADPIHALQYMFLGGPPPASPFPDCGTDTSLDAVSCFDGAGCDT